MSRRSAYLELTDWKTATPFIPLRSEPLPDRTGEQIEQPACPVEDLTEPQMLAMMQMSDRLRHQAIWHKERERFSCPPFTLSTFVELRDAGLAYKPEGKRFHMLTAPGQEIANEVADYLVKTKGIHAPYMLGHVGPTTTVACTCGWSAGLRRGDNMQIKAARAFSSHLQDLRARQAVADMAASIVPRHHGEDDFNQETEG